jgi:PEP-CTERM motif
MTFVSRSLAVVVAVSAIASTAQAAVYQYQFQNYYDPTTSAVTDTKAFGSIVAGLTLTDVTGGVQLTLKFKDTSLSGNNMYLDEFWLGGDKSGSLTRVSGDGGTYRYFSNGFTTPERQRLNWDIDFADGAFKEGETTTLKITGNGITALSLLQKAPQIEIANASQFGGRWGLNKTVRFIGTLAPIPEPSTYALMGLGLVGVALVARKRKAA